MAQLKTNFISGDAIIPGTTGSTNGLNATNDRVNTHTHEGSDTALLTRYPQLLASGSGTTSLTGNGTDQSVFSDSFTAPSSGDMLEMVVKYDFQRTAGAGNATPILKLGNSTVTTVTLTNGATNVFTVRKVGSATGARGFLVSAENNSGTPTGANSNNLTTYTDTITDLTGTVSLTMNTAAATNGNYNYSYVVIKYTTGI